MNIKIDQQEHLYEFIEIIYVMDGSGIHGIDGIEYQVKRHYIKTATGMAICNILQDPESFLPDQRGVRLLQSWVKEILWE